ncbi:TPA: hypothetical protein EYO12_02865 [Candidatus Saccharibacteria bacterium]|nr:hypothetical protein [Candidatus Saccharibacteria bacterium]HIO88020.1 hypothetical protein [Candidatus Saccharibacteria bacterium]
MIRALVGVFTVIIGVVALCVYLYQPAGVPAQIGILQIDDQYGWEKITGQGNHSEVGKLIHSKAVLDYDYGESVRTDPSGDFALISEIPVEGENGYTARVYEFDDNIELVVNVDSVDTRLDVLPRTLYAFGHCEDAQCKQAIITLATNLKEI